MIKVKAKETNSLGKLLISIMGYIKVIPSRNYVMCVCGKRELIHT